MTAAATFVTKGLSKRKKRWKHAKSAKIDHNFDDHNCNCNLDSTTQFCLSFAKEQWSSTAGRHGDSSCLPGKTITLRFHQSHCTSMLQPKDDLGSSPTLTHHMLADCRTLLQSTPVGSCGLSLSLSTHSLKRAPGLEKRERHCQCPHPLRSTCCARFSRVGNLGRHNHDSE